MDKLIKAIEEYEPLCEQEQRDAQAMLQFISRNPDALLRENAAAHFTASGWAVNPARDKALMVWHNIYRSWAWTGGHADGEEDLLAVAVRELREETGVQNVRAVSEKPFSLELLTVDGHIKRGAYVSSHLHLNLTYLLEVGEDEALRCKPDENGGVRWIPLGELQTAVSEPWMYEHIYKKLEKRVFEFR